MNRRDFCAASCLTAGSLVVAGCQQLQRTPQDTASKQYLELRHYEISSPEQQEQFNSFLRQATIPAFTRLGISPVGVFKMAENENADLWVLVPHDSLESVVTANTKMMADSKYLEAGKDVLTSPKDQPVYKRLESSLLLAFDNCPKVEVPSKSISRVFQLRIYESHNTTMAKRKIEMFDKAGEISLFRQTGLNPVFFGESIIGGKMPNLTYMVGFDDIEMQKEAWDKFRQHPEWKKLSSDPYFKDTVSNITNLVMRPTSASQI